MGSPKEINVFVAHAFSPKCGSYEKTAFRNVISRLFDMATTNLNLAAMGFSYRVNFEFVDFQNTISEQLHTLLDKADLGIVELSDNNNNVLYELGYLTAKGTPTFVLKSQGSKRKGFELPVDVSARVYCEYEDINEIPDKLLSSLSSQSLALIRNRTLEKRLLQKVWFPSQTQIIHIVCSQEYETVSSQKLTSPYYTHLDNLCDKDALLETMLFLSRNYQEARLVKYSDQEFSVRQNIKDNLVLIGGPGSPSVLGGNTITRLILERIRSRVHYTSDCETMMVLRGAESQELKAEVSEKGIVKRDLGYFARMPNPFNPQRTVILIHGIHNTGVLGAAQLFSDKTESRHNFREVEHLLIPEQESSFECICSVDVFDGEVVTPRLSSVDVFSLPYDT